MCSAGGGCINKDIFFNHTSFNWRIHLLSVNALIKEINETLYITVLQHSEWTIHFRKELWSNIWK